MRSPEVSTSASPPPARTRALPTPSPPRGRGGTPRGGGTEATRGGTASDAPAGGRVGGGGEGVDAPTARESGRVPQRPRARHARCRPGRERARGGASRSAAKRARHARHHARPMSDAGVDHISAASPRVSGCGAGREGGVRDARAPAEISEKLNKRGGTFLQVVAARLVSSSFAGQLGLDLAWRLHSQTRRGLDRAPRRSRLASRSPHRAPCGDARARASTPRLSASSPSTRKNTRSPVSSRADCGGTSPRWGGPRDAHARDADPRVRKGSHPRSARGGARRAAPADDPWEEVRDESTGQTYWWNVQTNETTALGAPKPQPGAPPPAGVHQGSNASRATGWRR